MKRMKQYLSMAALALVGALMTGCSSEDDLAGNQQPENKNNLVTLTTTVSLDGGATTRALTTEGVKTFAEGETMAVIYHNGTSTVKAVSHALEAGDITNEGKNATFTFDLETPNKSASVLYIYPAAMAGDTGVDMTKLNTQEGTFDALQSKYDLCTKPGAWDGENLPSLTLENLLAILAITLKNSDGSSDITSSITSLTVGDGTNTYAVTRETGAGPIYVAIRPATGATITVNATDGSKNYTKTLTDKTYAASQGYNVSWRMTEKPDFLSGVFSVSSTKKVKFSKGNLRYASGTWSFFNNQYDYYASYSADAWDKFGWSNSTNNFGMSTSTENAVYQGDLVDWGTVPGIGTGWFTLSRAEWEYLFDTRSASNGRYAKAKVNNVQGIILFPDTYTHPDGVTAPTGVNATNSTGWYGNSYTVADWTKMESAGCVFLPAAGYRNGSSVVEPGTNGYYWIATHYDAEYAYGVYFSSSILRPAVYDKRSYGYSVRLVCDVE